METQLKTEFAGTAKAQEIHLMLGKLSELGLRILPPMMIGEGAYAGLFCHKLLESSYGVSEPIGTSITYSLITWLGLSSAFPIEVVQHSTHWRTAQDRLSGLLLNQPEAFSLGDLGLLLCLSSRADAQWTGRALEISASRWEREKKQLDSMQLSWLLMGLIEARDQRTVSNVHSLLEKTFASLLGCYNASAHLFAFERFRGNFLYYRRPYRHVLGSFASQAYPLLALSTYIKAFPNHTLTRILKQCADRVCELQGPQGEWWWIYDVRHSRVIQDFPVYSVHQDGMAPMALLSTMEVLDDAKFLEPISRGLRYLFEYREPRSGEGFINATQDRIWRAVVRDLPGEDPADLPFGLSRLEFEKITSVGWRGFLKRRREIPNHGFRLLKETRPYCPGWILFAYALASRLFGKGTDLRMDWTKGFSQTPSIGRDETND